MFEQAQYAHPEVGPFSAGSWKEVFYSWVIAALAITAVLLIA